MDTGQAREFFEKYGPAAAYVEIENPNGDRGMGSAFHVGEGIFVTARHVVEGSKILEIGMTESTYIPMEDGDEESPSLVNLHVKGEYRRAFRVDNGKLSLKSGPHFHADENVDVAVFQVEEIDPRTPVVMLGSHLDDWLGESDFVLTEAIVLGYPPIPMSKRPPLVGARAEVNAQVDLYDTPYVHFVLSATARGGFSGGMAFSEYGFVLGMVTKSLTENEGSVESGYMAVIGVEPIYECLASHCLLPDIQAEEWGGFWESSAVRFYDASTHLGGPGKLVSGGIDLIDSGKRVAIAVSCDSELLRERISSALMSLLRSSGAVVTSPYRQSVRFDFPERDEQSIALSHLAFRAAMEILISANHLPISMPSDLAEIFPEYALEIPHEPGC
ncbi:serine protease [Kitasatospora sp. NPDC085879]|uniref:S1 family peptidase n=1 Tax=Kitasatospora sp. NPDC085879 TaxID=3154769 RepID=UPI003440AA1E